MSFEIAVVGSLNLDTTLRVPRLPLPGETVLGTGRFSDTGGKGANQAVAAARLGRSVAMVGAVGDDDAGVALLRSLAEAGVDISAVGVLDGIGSGMAVISVADTAENTIVVDPGANSALDPQQVRRAAEILSTAAVTLAQLEVPIGAVATAAVLTGGRFVLNPAPAGPIPADILERVSVLVPNASELGVLVGDAPPGGADEAARMARAVRGPGAVVVTLGAGGAVVVEGRRVVHVPAPSVVAVDPTAAGDAFCAGLADGLVRGLDLVDAVRWAVRCGAVAATRWGAQASLPNRGDVEALA
ncbi:MAG: ribokinase [Actinomycetota bacterium]